MVGNAHCGMVLQLFVARWTTQRFYRSMAQQQVADEHQKEIRAIK